MTGWCLQSDVVPDSRLQVRGRLQLVPEGQDPARPTRRPRRGQAVSIWGWAGGEAVLYGYFTIIFRLSFLSLFLSLLSLLFFSVSVSVLLFHCRLSLLLLNARALS